MRLFNQTKNHLSWSMGGAAYACEPWGAVDIPEELVAPAKARGLPLDVAPVAPDSRAKQRIADEEAAAKQNATIALQRKLEEANAALDSAKREIGALHAQCSEAKSALRLSEKEVSKLNARIATLLADKEAAEQLLAHESARATDAEERAIRAEATLTEPQKPTKAKVARAD